VQGQAGHTLFVRLLDGLSVQSRKSQGADLGTAVHSVGEEPSGVLLLKVIIRESHSLDSNATTAMIRTKLLSSLDTYIATIASDITKFNQYVKLLVQLLHTRRETTTNLLTNLFKGYTAASNQIFQSYIERKLETWEELGGDDDTMSADVLMALANEKFKIMKNKGAWNAPSANEEKMTALIAQDRQAHAILEYRRQGGHLREGKEKSDFD
jgi:hypothetical protein